MTKHVNTHSCPRCTEMLKDADTRLLEFATGFQAINNDAHISCVSRGEADQEADFKKGVSRAHYGQSAHNCTPSAALDWFRIGSDGSASFDAPWYRDVLAPAAEKWGLVWGGSWKSIKDMPHVELPDWKKS